MANVSPNPIILRTFLRPSVDPNETKMFLMMGDAGLGAKCYGYSPKYRLEQYFPSRVMKAPEINEKGFRRHLAIKLAGIHNLQPSFVENKKGYIINILDNPEFMKTCRANCLDLDILNEEEKVAVNEMKYLFEDPETDFVRKMISEIPVVFSHNDIWVGNLLVLDNSDDIVYLDYEVMDYNFPGYDIGKLLLEVLYVRHPTLPTYELRPFSDLPSEEDTLDFLKYYLAGRNGAKEVLEGDILAPYYKTKEEADKALAEMLQQTRLGIMIAGWYCAHLGMRLGKRFSSVLNFIKFAEDGHTVYKHFKKLYFSSN